MPGCDFKGRAKGGNALLLRQFVKIAVGLP